MTRKPYPGDVTADERAFGAPSLMLMKEEAPPRSDHQPSSGWCYETPAVSSPIYRKVEHEDWTHNLFELCCNRGDITKARLKADADRANSMRSYFAVLAKLEMRYAYDIRRMKSAMV